MSGHAIPPEVVECPHCGKAWTRTNTNHGRTCNTCRNKRRLQLNGANVSCAKILTLDTITSAPCRPRDCSAARWRCELRRRANPEYYAEFGMDV